MRGERMNVADLFKMQKALDEKIEANYKAEEKITKLRIAVAVELSEFLNEWKQFKYWSKSKKKDTEKMLVEYADGLHMILSLGLALGIELRHVDVIKNGTIYDKVLKVLHILTNDIFKDDESYREVSLYYYEILLGTYLGIAKDVGFTESDIIISYHMKNMINHKRISEGY